MKNLTIQQFFKQFPNDGACLDHLMEVRYGMKHTCSNCGKEAKHYKLKNRKAYSCEFCGNHVYPGSGTLFENSRTSMQLWFYAIYLFTSSRHGVSGKELQRQLGVTYKCAWRMGHEIRKHMATVDGDDELSGHIEVDEAYFGGTDNCVGRPGKDSNKTAVLGMIERDGDVMTKVVPNVKTKTLIPLITDNVEKGSTVSSDEYRPYKNLPGEGYIHGYVMHSIKQWKKGIHHTNNIEAFWSHLKKSIGGTHIHVSKQHLQKYLEEFEYRFNSRKNPEQMFPELISSFPEKQTKE